MTDPRYPIGKYEPKDFSTEQKEEWLNVIANLPESLNKAVAGLSEAQLQTPYREGGWTVRQLVHHVADSHTNAYIRFKLGLTETNPTIKPYEEKEWALLPDVETVSISVSLTLLEAIHTRWYATIKDITEEQLQRTVVHPEHGRQMTLWFLLGMYAWHSKHHVAHITTLREKNNW